MDAKKEGTHSVLYKISLRDNHVILWQVAKTIVNLILLLR